jgi:hypothetical protein
MKLSEFFKIYNFRQYEKTEVKEKEYGTQIVRIYPNISSNKNFFDIGVYDFYENNCLSEVINKNILAKEVGSMRVNKDLGILVLDLEDPF